MPISIVTEIPHKAPNVCALVGTPDRLDFVNLVESCVYSDGIRRFKIDGSCDLAQSILLNVASSFLLESSLVYSSP